MIKRCLIILFTSLTLIMVVGCSNTTNAPEKKQETSATAAQSKPTNTYGDYLHDKVAMEKVIASIKEKAGTPTKLFKLDIGENNISFKRQDQTKPKNLDGFEFQGNTWRGPIQFNLQVMES